MVAKPTQPTLQPDWALQYKAFLSSPLGENLVNELGSLRQRKLQDAETADPSQQATLLNHAYGVRLVLERLQFLAISPEDEGGKAS